MIKDFLHLFEFNGTPLILKGNTLISGKERFPVKENIPRFTPDYSYSTGNFSKLRDKHATLQLDSINKTNDRLNTILTRTGWPRDFFKGKLILECGCGAGPDTEILLDLGAKVVAVDIAGVDVAQRNLKSNKNFRNVQFVQDDITGLHLKTQSFDIVFCHRVLQHTPNPEKTLTHILRFVKKSGHVFVHSYSNDKFQMRRWKYFLLPLTNKLPSNVLYMIIKFYAWPAFYLTNLTNKFSLGQKFNHMFIPFFNYRSARKFQHKSNRYIVEYGIHDTFDALSPQFDKPMAPEKMKVIAQKMLNKKFEICKYPGITLLRTRQ